jgi:hypothetical protein
MSKKGSALKNFVIVAIVIAIAFMAARASGGVEDQSANFKVGIDLGHWGWVEND